MWFAQTIPYNGFKAQNVQMPIMRLKIINFVINLYLYILLDMRVVIREEAGMAGKVLKT